MNRETTAVNKLTALVRMLETTAALGKMTQMTLQSTLDKRLGCCHDHRNPKTTLVENGSVTYGIHKNSRPFRCTACNESFTWEWLPGE